MTMKRIKIHCDDYLGDDDNEYDNYVPRSQQTGVPLYSFVEDMAVSGGYLIACAAPTILVSR